MIYVLKNLGGSDTETDTQEEDDRKRHGGSRHIHIHKPTRRALSLTGAGGTIADGSIDSDC